MNRRSFLSSLAALSLPAVVAGKVAEIAGYGTLVSVNGCDCRQCWDCLCDCIEPANYAVEISGVVPVRRISVEQACEEFALPLSHFQPITNAIGHCSSLAPSRRLGRIEACSGLHSNERIMSVTSRLRALRCCPQHLRVFY